MLTNSKRKIAGIILALFISALIIAIFLALLNAVTIIPNSSISIAQDIVYLVRTSAFQATLSTIFSLFIGIMIAFSLNRLHFFGRNLIVALFASAIVTPAIIIALGIISVWGRAGLISDIYQIFGLNWNISIFGLKGILLAHTILNGAFAATILLARLDAIAIKKLKIGQSLNLSPIRRFLTLDMPAISSALPALGAIIFLLAFTSFPIVLMLGGGIGNQTLEVAIFSAVRLSFDLKTAVQLSIVQLLLCIIIILPAVIFTPSLVNIGSATYYKWRDNYSLKFLQISILILAIFIFISPLLTIFIEGFNSRFFATIKRDSFLKAGLTSLTIGSISAILTLYIAIKISQAKTCFNNKIKEALFSLAFYSYLIIPAVVLSLGFYLLAQQLNIATKTIAPFVLILGNILLALPFAISILSPSFKAINNRYDKLSRSLNISNYLRWRYIEWPLIGREIGLVLALSFCFSLGDLGIISLFATNEFTTLPWAIFQASSAYRNNDASTIAAIMLLLTFASFFLLPIIFRKLSHVRN